MRFYHIKDEYIAFLRQYDQRVALNKQQKRPYIGVVVEVDGMKYYAPLTSPKPKHRQMKNGKDFRKIKQGEYGAINFNSMIPVIDSALLSFDIEQIPDEQYRRLLQNQYKAVKADKEAIEKTAEELHTLVLTEDALLSTHDREIKTRCCDFALLESVCEDYDRQMCVV